MPGEHDTSVDDGKMYLERYGKGTKGNGWYSFDHKGVHFIGLVNVVQLEGMGKLGQAQLDWLKKDLHGVKSSTPIVVFAHIPLWAVYPEWGWGTSDSEQAFAMLKRFGSVTVLNGHIHQVMQKVEGNVMFHTAMSTAFPQPAPGAAPSPGPMKVPAERLQSVLGITDVSFVAQRRELAIVDATLSGMTCAIARVRAVMVGRIAITLQRPRCWRRQWDFHCASVGRSARTLTARGEMLGGSEVPQGVRQVLEQKCADCHSNQTHWPVYSRLAPGSWLMEHDVSGGRAALELLAVAGDAH